MTTAPPVTGEPQTAPSSERQEAAPPERAPDKPARAGAQHARDFLAPALFALIAEVRRTQARVSATAGRRNGGANDPEAIHDFRVALRRLRTTLRPARRVFGKRRLREIGAGLRRFAQATGALRDEEVLRETLVALELPPRARAELAAWLVQRARQERVRRRAVVALLTAPDGPDGPSLGTALAHLERRIGRRRHEEIGTLAMAEATAAAAFAGVEELASADPRDVAAMHALRIRFKRLRYSAELFAPALGERSAVVAKSAARMQKRLGELHDVDEALVRVGRSRGFSDTGAAAVHRALLRMRRDAADRAHRDLDEALGRISAALSSR